MKCYFRTNITNSSGIGNYMRCLRLASKFRQNGIKSIIFTDNNITLKENKFIKHEALYKNGRYISENKDAQIFLKSIKEPGYIFLDDYRLGIKWQKEIKKTTNKLILITDFFHKKCIADFIINTKPDFLNPKLCDDFKKTCSENTKLLLGPKYSIIDKKKSFKKKKITNKFLIGFYFGGSGNLSIPLKIIKKIKDTSEVKNFVFYIFIGPYSKNKKKLLEFKKKNLVKIKIIDQSLKISENFAKLDLLVSSAGVSIFESSLYKVPTILFQLVKNQKVNLDNLEKIGHYFLLNKSNLLETNKIAKLVVIFFKNKKRIKKIFSKNYLDDKGSERIVKFILKNKTDLISRKLEKKDDHVFSENYKFEKITDFNINKYLQVRNLEINRKYSINKKKINNIDHYIWWFDNNRESYFFKKGNNNLIIFFQDKIKIAKKYFIIPGWYSFSNRISFLEILKGIKAQYTMLMVQNKLKATQIGIIDKKNIPMIKFAKNLNWLLLKKSDLLLNLLRKKIKISKRFNYYKR